MPTEGTTVEGHDIAEGQGETSRNSDISGKETAATNEQDRVPTDTKVVGGDNVTEAEYQRDESRDQYLIGNGEGVEVAQFISMAMKQQSYETSALREEMGQEALA